MSEERLATLIDRKLGERVRARRLELGMSQEMLAETLGITFQQIQKYETGKNRIAAGRLWDICMALDLPIAQLFEGISRRKGSDGATPIGDVLSTPGAAELVRTYASIKSQKVRRRVLDLVRAMNELEE